MKLVIAYVPPDCLDHLRHELHEAGVHQSGIICFAKGFAQEKIKTARYRGADVETDLEPKARLEIAVDDDHVEAATHAIVDGARSKDVSQGNIFVVDLAECSLFRTKQLAAATN